MIQRELMREQGCRILVRQTCLCWILIQFAMIEVVRILKVSLGEHHSEATRRGLKPTCPPYQLCTLN